MDFKEEILKYWSDGETYGKAEILCSLNKTIKVFKDQYKSDEYNLGLRLVQNLIDTIVENDNDLKNAMNNLNKKESK